MREKPARVEVGQRYEYGAHPDWGIATILEAGVSDSWWLQWSGLATKHPERTYTWLGTSILQFLTYLGTTKETGGGVPKPAKGQRWRWTPRDGRTLMSSQACLAEWFDLGKRHEHRAWKIARCSGGCADHSFFADRNFENGDLTFVDHGETASPPSQPKTAAGVHVVIDECVKFDEAEYERVSKLLSPKPSDLTALQPLATFSLPGDVAPQTTAYFTRSANQERP